MSGLSMLVFGCKLLDDPLRFTGLEKYFKLEEPDPNEVDRAFGFTLVDCGVVP